MQSKSLLCLSQSVFVSCLFMIMFLIFRPAQAEQSLFFDEVKIRSDLMFGSIETFDLTDHTDTLSINTSSISTSSSDTNSLTKEINEGVVVADKIINLGEKVWNIVQKGRASISYSGSMASALPAHVNSWEQLESWKTPQTKVVRMIYKNIFGLEVARFTYRIILLYGGRSNGVGEYIGYATIEPLEIISSYLYDINAKASVASVYNKGDSKNPIAAMILNIEWSIETVFKKVFIKHAYNLDGSGNIIELGNAQLIEQD